MHDVIVIGGGPAGSTVAARMAGRGLDVLVIEAERFPRFHVGESLLPACVPLLDALGVKAKVDSTFLRKNAAEFVSFDGSIEQRYPFADGFVEGPGHAYEVDRASFDAILLDNAVARGASLEYAEVTQIELRDSDVEVRLKGGERRAARFLVDASGQRSVLSSQLRLRKMDPELKNAAMFSHYEGATRHSGEREGDITIVLSPEGWWWVIPLAGGRSSVGMVAPGGFWRGRKLDADLLAEQARRSPYLSKRLDGARIVAPVRSVSDYSYASQRFTGQRWLLLGDAAAFIDPVFSTGICLGMLGAFRAAEAIHRLLGRDDERELASYGRWLERALATYRRFVLGFYTPEMVELLLHPSDRLGLRAAVTSLLAGEALERFDVGWRTLLFLALARANRRLPLVPRLLDRRAGRG